MKYLSTIILIAIFTISIRAQNQLKNLTNNGSNNVETLSNNIVNSFEINADSYIISVGSDDAREKTTGAMTLNYNNLQLGGRSDVNNNAFRFQNVQIPADAKITIAYIEFYSYGTSPAANMEIFSEIGNPLTYTIGNKNITSRKYSSNKIGWQTEAWTKNKIKYQTPNLKTIIDENRLSGWSSGNSLAFNFVGLSSNNGANVYSYEGGANYRPRLVIEYQNNGGGPSIDGAVTNPSLMTQLYINEVSSQGTTDEKNDWIELYNNHDFALHIEKEVYLSNKKGDKTLHELKNIFIPAKGFVVLIADKTPELGNNYLNFNLKNSGGSVYLSRKSSENIIQQDDIKYPEMPFNESYGRSVDGSGTYIPFILSTYNKSNQQGKVKLNSTLSHLRGVYPTGFNLIIPAPEGATVKYTLDGSFPSETNGIVYNFPIPIEKTTVVKYYIYDATGNSGVVSHTYILRDNYSKETLQHKNAITAAEYAQAIGEIPIVSASTKTNVSSSWKETSFEYIDNNVYNNRSNFFSNSMGRKFGQASIGAANSGVKFKFNKEAVVKKANYSFFDNYPDDQFKTPTKIQTIELKEGQDGPQQNIYSLGFMRYSEKISMNLQKEMGKYALDTRYVHFFMNGKYGGVKTMRNDFKANNIEEIFGDDNDNYTTINLQDAYFANGTVGRGDGDPAVWKNIKNLASSKDFQKFKEVVDVDDLIKFQIMFMFIDCENEAVAIVHNQAPNFMKTKFNINDTDGAFFGGLTSSSSIIPLNPLPLAGGGGNYKYKWERNAISRKGPGGLFGQFMGSNTDIAGNLEFKTLVKDAVLKNIGSASGTFEGTDEAPLSVKNVQQKMNDNIQELDNVYKLDAAWKGYTADVYNKWKTIDHPRIVAQVPDRVKYNLEKWLEYEMAHTLSNAIINAEQEIVENTPITIINTNTDTQVYYTTNGTDPMGSDGIISPDAHLYNSEFILPPGNYTVMTRAFQTHNWGPISYKAIKVKSSSVGSFILTGINYKPKDNDKAEFVLITNPSNDNLDISGYTVSDAFVYTFPKKTILSANTTILLGKNLSLITGFNSMEKYQWTSGSLNNDGEPITFKDSSEKIVEFVIYDKKSPWPTLANGGGYYLKLKDYKLNNELPQNWEAVLIGNTNARYSENKFSEFTKEIGVKIYPNPASSELHIQIPDNKGATIYIYNFNGKLELTNTLKQNNNILNISHLSTGVYNLRIVLSDQAEQIFRLIKK